MFLFLILTNKNIAKERRSRRENEHTRIAAHRPTPPTMTAKKNRTRDVWKIRKTNVTSQLTTPSFLNRWRCVQLRPVAYIKAHTLLLIPFFIFSARNVGGVGLLSCVLVYNRESSLESR